MRAAKPIDMRNVIKKEGWLYAALVPALFLAFGCAAPTKQSRRQAAVRQTRAQDMASQVERRKVDDEKPVRSAPTEPPANQMPPGMPPQIAP